MKKQTIPIKTLLKSELLADEIEARRVLTQFKNGSLLPSFADQTKRDSLFQEAVLTRVSLGLVYRCHKCKLNYRAWQVPPAKIVGLRLVCGTCQWRLELVDVCLASDLNVFFSDGKRLSVSWECVKCGTTWSSGTWTNSDNLEPCRNCDGVHFMPVGSDGKLNISVSQ